MGSFNRSVLSRKKQPLPLTYPSTPHLPPPNHKQGGKKLPTRKTHLHRSDVARSRRCKSEDGHREEGFVLWTSLRLLPRTPQTCPLQETSPSSILAGGPHHVASCPRGCPCGVNTPPDKINPLPNHTAQNLVHCKWTSQSEAGLSPSSKMLYVTRLTDVLSSHPSSNFSSTACATFYGELTFAMFRC